jgi:mitochondrial enoyl-[acyl-carrier protein] reductase / trans-2-enoyl-CoA reductase
LIKKIQFDRFGLASEVLACVEAPFPTSPEAEEVAIEMIYMPLNPSDLMVTAGIYGGAPPPLPYAMGREGVGRVIEVGPGVSKLSVGDLVIAITAPTWQSVIVRNVNTLILLPEEIDLQQAAMLRSCPATAALMLRNFVELKSDDWVIQNVANSAVGTCFAQLASSRGIRTLNIVRRAEAGAHLAKIPGAIVIEHIGGPSDALTEKVLEATGGVLVKFGIDAIAGPATDAIAQCLADGATLVNYGVLSKEPCQIYGGHLHFRGITMRGFWVSKWLELAKPAEIQTLYTVLANYVVDKTIHVEIAGTYAFDQINAAAAHAASEARGGKILISPE